VDFVAVPLNMADSMGILTICFAYVHNTVNWKGPGTFSAVKSEIPAFAATVTAGDS